MIKGVVTSMETEVSGNKHNNKTWILFPMSTYSFDEPKFTSARVCVCVCVCVGGGGGGGGAISKTPKFTVHNPPEH